MTDYVTKASWLRQIGRVDAIDEVADQFERPVARGAEAFWTPDTGAAWPRSARGWRAAARVAGPEIPAPVVERRVAS